MVLNVLLPVLALVVGIFYMMRRKARLKAED
jgi:hypothetical protein